MKNSKRFRRLQDNQKHSQPKVSKYAAKQRKSEESKDPMGWDRYDELVASALRNA